MVQPPEELSQLQQEDVAEKTCRSRSSVPISGRITSFFQMRKRKNSPERKDVEVLVKRSRSEGSEKQQVVEPKNTDVTSPLGIFGRLPNNVFDTFAEYSSWRTLISVAKTSSMFSARLVDFIHRDKFVARFVRDADHYVTSTDKTALENPFANLANLCNGLAFGMYMVHETECSRELLKFCTKASAKITDVRSWSRFLFEISRILYRYIGNFDHCKQMIDLLLEMKVPQDEGHTEKRSIRELVSKVVYAQQAGEFAEEEMKVRSVVRCLFIDEETHLNEEEQAIWMTCLMRSFRKVQQARLLLITFAPTMEEGGTEVIDWRSLCDRDVTDQEDAELRIKQFAIIISKLSKLAATGDGYMSWTSTEIFNLIEEVSTCPEAWAFDNFIALLVQEPTLIPIALTARMTHGYVEEAGNLVSAMKTLLFRWNIPFSQGFSEAFTSSMTPLSASLRREFLSSIHDAQARTIKSLLTSSPLEIGEEIAAQGDFVPLLQQVVHLL